jgi:hypothetical protein
VLGAGTGALRARVEQVLRLQEEIVALLGPALATRP